MERPTQEQIKEAREWLTPETLAKIRDEGFEQSVAMVEELVAATEPPTDDDLYAAAETAWNNGGAENESDFVEGFFVGVRAFLGTPEPT
jgi:hypothetical protein